MKGPRFDPRVRLPVRSVSLHAWSVPNTIEAEGLVREFKKGPLAAVRLDRPARRSRRDLRLPRARTGRAVYDIAHA